MKRQEIEFEKVPLVQIFRQGERVYIELHPDADKYVSFGILKTYTDALQKKLVDEWKEE